MINPLLDTTSLPRFDEIEPEHVVPAIQHLITTHREQLDSLLAESTDPDFDSFVGPIELMEHELGRVWSPVTHLQSVLGSPDWRNAFNKALPLLTAHSTELSQNAKLQRAYAGVGAAFSDNACESQRSAVDQALRDFHLAGVGLPMADKDRFKEIMQELAAIQASFEHKIQDASDAWSLHIQNVDELVGVPQQVLNRAAEGAAQRDLDGWLLLLDYPTYDAVMTHAHNRDLREHLYRAWATRGSDMGDHPEWDNSENIEKILALRHEAAALVGFENYAEYSLATKMAECNDQVLDFLRELARRSRPAAEQEFSDLQEFAEMSLAPWDLTFWLEKYKQAKFSVSNEALRQYFPAKTVFDGLFSLAAKLYSISLEQSHDVAVWHKDARYFSVKNAKGQVIGGFYADIYARNGKRSGAWIDECISRQNVNGYTALPVGYLVCNFPPPDDNGLSLLTHDDVVTLFHEFGHMLHHLLTRIEIPSVSGIKGVPWDAVELPSQFMENFAWNYEVLRKCSAHASSGEPLPREMFDKLERSRTAGAGLAMLRQLELGMFDFRLHSEYRPDSPVPVLTLLDDVRDEICLLEHPDYNRMPHSFTHIFSGSYGAGYYSYKWAEVLAADAFSAFQEAGIFDSATAKRFRHEILEVGGSRDFMQTYVAFRGREPATDALLRQDGIQSA